MVRGFFQFQYFFKFYVICVHFANLAFSAAYLNFLSCLCYSSILIFHFWAIFVYLYFNQIRSSLYLQSELKTPSSAGTCLKGMCSSISQYTYLSMINYFNQLPLMLEIGFTTSFKSLRSLTSLPPFEKSSFADA